MALDIEILTGPLKGKRMRLPAGVHVVGRGVGTLPFQDPGLSSEHARLHVFPHRIEVEDLGSTNGTFVNDGAVKKLSPLNVGDVVRLGPESSFRVVDPAEGKRGAAKGLVAVAEELAEEEEAALATSKGGAVESPFPRAPGATPFFSAPRREDAREKRRRALRWFFVALFAAVGAGMLFALKKYFEEMNNGLH